MCRSYCYDNNSNIKDILENEYYEYINNKKKIINLFNNYYDKKKNLFKIQKFLLIENSINKELLNYYGFCILYHDDFYTYINENENINNIIQIILEETNDKEKNEYLINFNLIKKYMPINKFKKYMNKYNNEWLKLDIIYKKELVKINYFIK